MRDIHWIVLHRIKVSHVGYEDSPDGIREFFRSHPDGKKATGGAYPYHYTIDSTGEIHETEPVEKATPHAAGHNNESIAVAVIGDFRGDVKPTWQQLIAAVYHCAALLEKYPEAEIVGHSDLRHGSSDPNKECPGSGMPPAQIAVMAALLSKHR